MRGNSDLKLIRSGINKSAIDIGCGSGENLFYLNKLEYKTTGVDYSKKQLILVKKMIKKEKINDITLIHDKLPNLEKVNHKYDLILSVGVLHFIPQIEIIINRFSEIIKPKGTVVISLPHPIDMLVHVKGNLGKTINFTNYFNLDDKISNAHYWKKFAGKLNLIDGIDEYIHKPSTIINSFVNNGFIIEKVLEPYFYHDKSVPCRYKNPDSWFVNYFCKKIPQYIIYKAIYK